MPPTPVLYLVRAHFIRFPEFDKSTQGLSAVRSSNGVGKGSSKSDDDDDTTDTEQEIEPPPGFGKTTQANKRKATRNQPTKSQRRNQRKKKKTQAKGVQIDQETTGNHTDLDKCLLTMSHL